MPNASNKKNSSLKTLLIVLGVGVVILAAVLFIGSRSTGTTGKGPSTGLVTQSSGTQVSAGSLGDTDSTARRSDQIVALLNSVSSIKLDDSIFRNPSFNALRDINSTLPADRNPGRDNPFLPIGQESSSGSTALFQQTEVNTNTISTETTTDSVVATGDAALQDFVGTSTTE